MAESGAIDLAAGCWWSYDGRMRLLALITFFSVCAFGQPSVQPPDSTQALLIEVQQLRLAIERSTLLGARTQIALQRIQVQEQRTRQLQQEANGLRTQADGSTTSRSGLETHLKGLEERLPRVLDPKERQALESSIEDEKRSVAILVTREQQARAREAEATSQLRVEQGKLQDLLARVDEMEKVLDAAIRQITEKK